MCSSKIIIIFKNKKKTKWRSDDSNCTRKVEYLTKIF